MSYDKIGVLTVLLCDLKLGDCAYITKINCKDDMLIRLYDLGLIEGTNIKRVLVGKDIGAYLFRNSLIAIRNRDCKDIVIGEVYD